MKKIQGKERTSIPFWETIGFRISLGIIIPMGLCLYAFISVAGFYEYFSGSFDIYNERKEKIDFIWTNVRIHEVGYRVKLAELKFVADQFITGDRSVQKEKLLQLLEDIKREIDEVYTLSGDSKRQDSSKIYNSISSSINIFSEQMLTLEKATDNKKIEDARQKVLALTQDLEQLLKRLKARHELFELQDLESIKNEFKTIRNDNMVRIVWLLVSGLFICLIVTYTITSPIKKVIGRLNDIATGEGDLSKRIQSRTIGEMRAVAFLMNLFLDTIHEIVAMIRRSTESIKESITQVNKHAQYTTISSAEINRSMMTQSISLEDCTSSVSRIDELLQATSESTRQAASLSRLAMDRALKGGSSVQETVGAMEKIEESAKKIEFLVSTINGIATQTNLLAINAAIEASKAGEHGKGFAVVAEEVRKLAERSKTLTVEVTDLISEANSRVKVGSNLARGAGVALDGIIKDVEAVASLIQRIAAASTKQTESSSKLLDSIQNVSQGVRKNLVNIEKVNRGAEVAGKEVEKLDGMMGQLNDMVKKFKLKADTSIAVKNSSMRSTAGVTKIPETVAKGITQNDELLDTDEIQHALVQNQPPPVFEEEKTKNTAITNLNVNNKKKENILHKETTDLSKSSALPLTPPPTPPKDANELIAANQALQPQKTEASLESKNEKSSETPEKSEQAFFSVSELNENTEKKATEDKKKDVA